MTTTTMIVPAKAPEMLPWWRAPREPAPPVVLWIGAAAGLSAATLVPMNEFGIGWFLAALIAVAAVAWHSRPVSVSRALWLGAALALLGIGALRAAEWLFILCVLGSLMCGSLAMAGGRSVRGLVFGAIAVPLAGFRSLPWVTRGLRRARPRNARMFASIGVSLLLLLVFGSLLASADVTFSGLMERLKPNIDAESFTWRLMLFTVVAFGAAGACYLVVAPATLNEDAPRKPGTLRPKDYVLPLGLLAVLFAVFVATQLAVMFGGSDYVMRTSGVTFAEYARSGFWQLLTVTVLTLAIIGVVARWATTESSGDRLWLRGLLGTLAVLTLVIVASALSRMWFYQQAYGFTVLRLLVGACELWLGLVYLMVIVAGVRLRANWLPRTILATGTAFFLTLALVDPERVVAGHNVTRLQDTGKIDVGYLSTLSADAVPELAKLPEPWRSCALRYVQHHVDDHDWRSWNASRATARDILAVTHLGDTPCETSHSYPR